MASLIVCLVMKEDGYVEREERVFVVVLIARLPPWIEKFYTLHA